MICLQSEIARRRNVPAVFLCRESGSRTRAVCRAGRAEYYLKKAADIDDIAIILVIYDKLTKYHGGQKMKLQNAVEGYLEYCKYRKELDANTLKAYKIDLKQYFEFVSSDEPLKHEIEEYITELHKKYKQKTIKRKLASIKAFYAYLEEEEFID